MTMTDFLLQKYIAVTSGVNCLEGTDPDDLCETGLPPINADAGNVQTMLQLLFGIIAVIAVIIIVIAGIRFITESTNPQETAKARNAIIYAVIGLAIALSAQIIVTFVLNRAS